MYSWEVVSINNTCTHKIELFVLLIICAISMKCHVNHRLNQGERLPSCGVLVRDYNFEGGRPMLECKVFKLELLKDRQVLFTW